MNSKFPIAHPRKEVSYGARQKRIYDFLHDQHVAVLSTVTPDHDPHGSVVYYAVNKDFTLDILTKTGTRKYDNIVHNDHVMLTVFDTGRQITAHIVGRAVEHAGTSTINRVADAVFGGDWHLGGDGLPPIVKLQAGRFTTFQIEPVQIRMAAYARPDPGDYRTIFDSIESFDLRDALDG